jgi:hypothetical protein
MICLALSNLAGSTFGSDGGAFSAARVESPRSEITVPTATTIALLLLGTIYFLCCGFALETCLTDLAIALCFVLAAPPWVGLLVVDFTLLIDLGIALNCNGYSLGM